MEQTDADLLERLRPLDESALTEIYQIPELATAMVPGRIRLNQPQRRSQARAGHNLSQVNRCGYSDHDSPRI
jgi:hypothetical protein